MATSFSCKIVRLIPRKYFTAFTDHSLPVDEAGDRICIFGFSRGAYTARGLAGMIHKVRSTYRFYFSSQGLYFATGWPASRLQSSTSPFRLQDVHARR